MAEKDQLIYFKARGRGEAIRMLYALAGKELLNETINGRVEGEWAKYKSEQPLGQLPVLITPDHGKLPHSNVIARYVAKKFGLIGCDLWDETQNDLVVETAKELFDREIGEKVLLWKFLKRKPEPENVEEVIEDVRNNMKKGLNYIQSIAEGRGKKFIIGDIIQLADVWLYVILDTGCVAVPEMMTLTPWVKEFVERMQSDEKFKQYLAERPESPFGV